MKDLCSGKAVVWESAGKRRIPNLELEFGHDPYPKGVKRKRLKCPKCGRKIISSYVLFNRAR